MKTLLLSTCAALILLGSIGCEMHPPSETIKADKAEKTEETGNSSSGGHH